jgi:hypothetical protein
MVDKRHNAHLNLLLQLLVFVLRSKLIDEDDLLGAHDASIAHFALLDLLELSWVNATVRARVLHAEVEDECLKGSDH